MTWHDPLNMLAFDLETDSAQPDDARIVTGALVLIAAGKQVESETWVVKPERPISDEAASIHGYSTERAEEEGTDRVEAIDVMAGIISLNLSRGTPVVGHNVKYDLLCIEAELARLGLPTITERLGRPVGPVICSMVLDKSTDTYRRGSRRLVDTAKHYAIDLSDEDAHNANADALTAARIIWRIAQLASQPKVRVAFGCKSEVGDKYAALGGFTVDELHAFQVTAAAAQAKSLKAYFTKAGKKTEAASVTMGWPT